MSITDVNLTAKEYTFESTDWVNLNLFKDEAVTIKSIGNSPVSIFISSSSDIPTDGDIASSYNTPIDIGGVDYEVAVAVDRLVYGKSSDGKGKVLVRISGTIDPSEDISHLTDAINEISIKLLKHTQDTDNLDHKVTKEQVGLGNIPNKIADDISTNNSDILATTKLTYTLNTKITNHIDDNSNPHQVDKEDIGLGKVRNFDIATDLEAIDETNNAAYMTPYSTSKAFVSWAESSLAVRSQTILEGKIIDRPLGWTNKDISATTSLIEKVSDTSVMSPRGLVVAFADNGKARVSLATTSDTTINIPPDVISKTYYVYCNINKKGVITDFSMTLTQPSEGFIRDGAGGDFFNVAKGVMLDNTDAVIRRVYIGRISVTNGKITEISSSALGFRCYRPVTVTLSLGLRTYISNPFIGICDIKAEVEYNANWGASGWNDQIGVMAHPHITNPIDDCILQCGQMGFLASGREAGSPFGANFQAITTPIRARVLFTKVY